MSDVVDITWRFDICSDTDEDVFFRCLRWLPPLTPVILCFLLTPKTSSEDPGTCIDVTIFVGADVEDLEDDKLGTIDADAAGATNDDDDFFAYQIK